MEYRSPAPIVAFVLAMVSGTLLATANYLVGAVIGVVAVLVFGLWQFANERGDDDRHTLW
jgi:uncharacterized YccA/Bax inhibitor family protein